MSHRPDNERLLSDVLAESSPPDFRAALLAETLCLARRQRRFRQGRRIAGVLAALGLAVIFLVQQFSPTPTVVAPMVHNITEPSYRLVSTQPLPANVLVSTRAFLEIQSALLRPPFVEVVTTSGGYHPLNDNQLLALLGDRPAILIRLGPDREELVFANPEDQKLISPR